MDDLRREFWLHKPSAHLWAVEVNRRDESLLACCGPFAPRIARVVAPDELAYARGATLEAREFRLSTLGPGSGQRISGRG